MAARPNRKKPVSKTISAAGITGQRGINAIERIVLDSGSRWAPSGSNEIGIDGYIELFDPSSHRPLGLTLAVQSKVVSDLANEKGHTFDYWCNPADISYWLEGNIPVILIVSSGDAKDVYWASVRDHFKDWKPGDSTTVTFVRADQKLDHDTFSKFATIASPKAGLYLAPARKGETLHANLLPLRPAMRTCSASAAIHPTASWGYFRNSAQWTRHTDLIEPLSLDEAYLDVSENKTGLPTATQVARTIREQIRTELNLTASAGVAPNKFLAKIASDWKKPDGLFVIQPDDVDSFLSPLPVGRLPGVGKVTEEKLKSFEIQSVAELRKMELPTLERRFGRYGVRLYELARGIDQSEVIPDRPTQSVSAEDTFEQDVPLTETEPMIRKLAEKTWSASRKELRVARTIVLKLKTSDFKILTRSHTPDSPPASCEELTNIALALRERVSLGPEQRFRLVGVGLSNFRDPDEPPAQPALFERQDLL